MVKVIVVDDDVDTVKVFSEFLRLKGIDVIGEGYNGKQAFELFQELRPDVVILDMRMPEYDGKYAIDAIKKVDPNAKIIVVTGYSDYRLDKGEVSAIFQKPYDIDLVIDEIHKLVTV